jgi:hypothetical protein
VYLVRTSAAVVAMSLSFDEFEDKMASLKIEDNFDEFEDKTTSLKIIFT